MVFPELRYVNSNPDDVVNYLNKNLIAHCLIFWEGKKVWDWNLSIFRVLNKEHFHEKNMKKICTKSYFLVPDLILVNISNSHYIKEIILKTRCFKRGLSKSPKIVNFIFPFEPNPISSNGQDYEKQKGPPAIDQLLSRL